MPVSQIQNASLANGVPSTAKMPAGSVIQVVNGFTSTNVTTTATEVWIDTGITATITPQFATSRILVIVNMVGMVKFSGSTFNRMAYRLLRNATVIINGAGQLWTQTSMYNRAAGAMYSKYDSPATTSAITYKMQFQAEVISDAGGLQVQADSNSGESQIILMEIAV